jgi:hypothetical protein
MCVCVFVCVCTHAPLHVHKYFCAGVGGHLVLSSVAPPCLVDDNCSYTVLGGMRTRMGDELSRLRTELDMVRGGCACL